ncbi:MAG: hypothetical protein KDD61_12325 [Bdellovibrionales bacterium]|nr:hypothetical protein [Bdellovibrionales bacterium]
MADLNDLLKSKKVSSFKRKQKARPWTVAVENERQKSKGASPAPESSSSDSEKIDNKIDNKSEESSFKETSTKSIDRPLEPSAGSAGANDMSPTKGIHKSEMSDSHESVKIIDNKKITEYGNPESLLDNKKITTQNTDSPETDNKKITVNRQQIDNKKITNRYQDSISSSNDINKLITNKDNKKITKEEKPFESLDNKKITLEATTSHLIDNKKITTNSDLPRETDNKKITESFYSSAPSTKVVVDKIDNKKITKEDETAELDNKQITESSDKIKESISKTDNKKITENEKQLDNKSITNEYQTDSNQLTSGYQIDSTRLTNEYQTDNYPDNNWITNLEVDTLVGHELKLLLIIFSDCKNSGALITPALNNESLRIRLETSAQVAKMVVHRLIKKGFVRRVDSKKGRGGWTKFGLSRQVYQQLLLGERDNKWISEQITERITTDSSKLIREKNITNSTNQAEEIYEDYSEIDISSLESLGITMKQIRDIKNQK